MGMKIIYLLLTFVFGIAGGIFADQILWPYFIERPLFYQYRLDQPSVYVTERKEVIIQENTALEEAVDKVSKTVVGVKTKLKNGGILEGSGIVITNDGLVVTLAELVPQGEVFSFFLEGKSYAFQVLKRDLKENLALIKLEVDYSTTIGFADSGELKLGERVFAISYRFGKDGSQMIVNEGIIKAISADKIETNILEESAFNGSPVFNIEGEIIGLAELGLEGNVQAIPISVIKSFTGF
ncbi:MAG: serine protease [bacterium]|nr:serine protease [bacterium]